MTLSPTDAYRSCLAFLLMLRSPFPYCARVSKRVRFGFRTVAYHVKDERESHEAYCNSSKERITRTNARFVEKLTRLMYRVLGTAAFEHVIYRLTNRGKPAPKEALNNAFPANTDAEHLGYTWPR